MNPCDVSKNVGLLSNKDRGVIPDYFVIPTIDDKINNNDVELKYALKLLSQ